MHHAPPLVTGARRATFPPIIVPPFRVPAAPPLVPFRGAGSFRSLDRLVPLLVPQAAGRPFRQGAPAMSLVPSMVPDVRRVRIRVFDGQHEVLHSREFIEVLDLNSPALGVTLHTMLAHLAHIASSQENEPMPHARLELWCTVSGRKLRDYSGGM